MRDWSQYKRFQSDEWEARKRTPVQVEVSAEMLRDAKFGLMLLGRVQSNTRDGDLLRVEEAIAPLVRLAEDAFRALPEVRQAINAQREFLDLPIINSTKEVS